MSKPQQPMIPANPDEWINWPPETEKMDFDILRFRYDEDPVLVAIIDSLEQAWLWAIKLNGTVEELKGMYQVANGELKIQRARAHEAEQKLAAMEQT